MDERPLVSVCFTCYNRKQFVSEALNSVLNQTYHPLEIVICDNASTDGTSEIVQHMVAKYREQNGRHSVVYLRNPTNVGGTANIEKCYRTAKGELLVAAHDDDISMPNRVEKIVQAWEGSNRLATYITHPSIWINSKGVELRVCRMFNIDRPSGAISTYSARVTREFDVYWEEDVWEDWIWAFRSRMIGQALYVDEPLVKYRIGTGISTSTVQFRKPYLDAAVHIQKGIRQARNEIKRFGGDIDPSRKMALEDFLNAEEHRTSLIIEHMAGSSFRIRYRAYKQRLGGLKLNHWNFVQFCLTLPNWIGDPIVNLFQFLRSHIRCMGE